MSYNIAIAPRMLKRAEKLASILGGLTHKNQVLREAITRGMIALEMELGVIERPKAGIPPKAKRPVRIPPKAQPEIPSDDEISANPFAD